ncbi:MAG: dolichyl-phosphate beta-glucosyltransferase [Bdellovibrionota bacterium]
MSERQTEAPQTEEPFLSVIIPAFNEQRRLPPTLLDAVDFLDSLDKTYEVIVVDDGSRDGTSAVVQKFEKIRSQVRLIRLPKNYGKGHAVRTGALNAHGHFILFADADGSTAISEVHRLLNAIEEGYEIAIGSRALRSDETEVKALLLRKVIGRVFNKIVNTILLPGIADTQCGFKLFSRKAANFLFSHQQSDGFSFDLELLFLAKKTGLSVREIAINWENVPGSKVNLLSDSLRMFLDIFRFAWIHRGVTPKSLATTESLEDFSLPQDSNHEEVAN